MASAFGHALAAVAFGAALQKKQKTAKFWLLGIVSSIVPDADVIGFFWKVPYDSFWGHRGFSHSILFASLWAGLIVLLFYRKEKIPKIRFLLALYFFACMLSHVLLDACTNGGLGVALFSPWDQTRYFFPYRPIQVSPIGIEAFFSEWGIRVILSEVMWIGVPALIWIVLAKAFRNISDS